MRNKTTKNALIVDDDTLALLAHRLPLIQLGFIVDEAKSGQEAIDKMAKNKGKYDLLLIDYNLPDFNAAIVTKKIRELEKHFSKRLTIIGITAHTDEIIKQLCLAAGMNELLNKPVLHDTLTALLSDI